jgi:hypothetical protein
MQFLEILVHAPAHIKCINNPSKKLQLEAIKKNWETIKYIKNPSEEVQLTAVKELNI